LETWAVDPAFLYRFDQRLPVIPATNFKTRRGFTEVLSQICAITAQLHEA
jgi:hypothetical protein